MPQNNYASSRFTGVILLYCSMMKSSRIHNHENNFRLMYWLFNKIQEVIGPMSVALRPAKQEAFGLYDLERSYSI
jgi:hypothetical protein